MTMLILYLIAGIIFTAICTKNSVNDDAIQYTMDELVIGGIIDIAVWPIVLLSELIKH